MAPGDLSRQQLVALVERIRDADGGEEDWLMDGFEENVPLPDARSLIFFPEDVLGLEYADKIAEEVVDHALADEPIEPDPTG
jgi:hypothetical protein